MSDTPNDFVGSRFSTAQLPQRERVPMLRDFIGPVVARLEIAPVGEGPVHFEVASHVLPDLAVSTVAFSPIRAERTHALTGDGNDNCLLSCLRSPGNTLVQRGNELTPPDGAGTLISMAEPFTCATVAGIARGITISMPRKPLAATVPGLEDRFGRTPIPNSEALRLLAGYVAVLEKSSLETPELRRVAASHVHDLVALALGASRDAAALASGRGLRAARLNAIKTDIRTCLAQQSLSLRAVAARHRVSPRYVQALFETDGTTFSHFLVGERLAQAHRMLCNPLHATSRIGAIAYAAGFSDLSYFNRAFRRCYGLTPSDVRAAARRERE